jgi:hypothetical protein
MSISLRLQSQHSSWRRAARLTRDRHRHLDNPKFFRQSQQRASKSLLPNTRFYSNYRIAGKSTPSSRVQSLRLHATGVRLHGHATGFNAPPHRGHATGFNASPHRGHATGFNASPHRDHATGFNATPHRDHATGFNAMLRLIVVMPPASMPCFASSWSCHRLCLNDHRILRGLRLHDHRILRQSGSRGATSASASGRQYRPASYSQAESKCVIAN